MINASFKVYWNNPIGLTTESSSEQLQFNIPLGAIIADPSVATDLSNYYTKPQTDTQISTSVTLKADKTYVDAQDSLLQDQINLKANASSVNQSLGTKADLVDGKIPASQLPSFVDDVLEGTYINPTTFNNLNNQPYTPETDKIYIDTTTNKTYRWSGMLYVVISSGGVALGETSETAYRGDRGKVAYDHSQSQGNPHNSTTSDITEGSRLYFTDARVRTTSLTGLSTATGGAISATDTVLGALGKIQNQVTNSGGGSSSPTWVNITTVGTIPAYVTNADIQLSRFQGMLWIRGTFNVNTTVASNSELFRITAQAYKPYSYSTAGTARILQLLSTWGSTPNSTKQVGIAALGNITNSSQASTVDVIFEVKGASMSTSDGTLNIPPTIIGTLAN
jgi:hypothetical protein